MPSPPGPGCPGDLDASAAAIWRKVRAILVKRGDWDDNADACVATGLSLAFPAPMDWCCPSRPIGAESRLMAFSRAHSGA